MLKIVSGVCAVMLLGAGAAWAQSAKPNDAQIAHIAYTAGEIDVKAGELALQKSKSKAVRDFATSMVKDHRAVNEKALALVKKLKVTPQDNDTSKALTKAGDRLLAEIEGLEPLAVTIA